ncbi:MAG: hypothetical protein OEZ09_07135 [Betaproteobacteria bacterium]|nr:hypothetical protein [Betaproteobacteria bacterium]MDH5578218.1 hypothetical protein [Betaproteobacteria bacterium]
MTENGALLPVVIRGHKKFDYSDKNPDVFEAYVNPSEITLGYEVEFSDENGVGTTGARMDFQRIKPGDMSLSFFIDGTGANGRKADVQQKVAEFQRVTGYSGEIHRSAYLEIAWGTLRVRRCVLKSASIAYKLFRPDGVPLRAVITAAFADNADDRTRVAMAQDESADLTHVRLVKAGDTLPGLCEQIYGEPRMYPAVARANGLDNFRDLQPGTQLRFPPLER